MDRDQRWDRTEKARRPARARARPSTTPTRARQAVKAAYERDETDEFITATTVGEEARIRPGDAVLAFNFRPDRMRQITTKLAEVVDALHDAHAYDEDWTFPSSSRRTARRSRSRKVIADAGRAQLHVAETEKYPHVTYFFNGGEEDPYDGRGARAGAVAARRPDLRPQAGDERARGDRRLPAPLGGAGLRASRSSTSRTPTWSGTRA